MYQFNWSPGIGDPTVGGWVTVVFYFVAVWSTWRTAGLVARTGEGHTWRAISVMFIGWNQ
jgi:hypothetical protein